MTGLSAAEWNERYPPHTPVWYEAVSGKRIALTEGQALAERQAPFGHVHNTVKTYPVGWLLLSEIEPLATDEQRLAEGWLPPDEASRLKADRHEFDETSVLNPATGKPFPLVWGEDNQPDPLCCCGAPWSDVDGGCQGLSRECARLAADVQALRLCLAAAEERLATATAGWLPPEEASKLRAAASMISLAADAESRLRTENSPSCAPNGTKQGASSATRTRRSVSTALRPP